MDKISNPPLALTADKNDEELSDLGGQDVNIIIPSNIIDIWTKLEVLLGWKLFDHTDTLTEASNVTDNFYKRFETQNKQQYQNVLDKFRTKWMELPSKLLEHNACKTRPKEEEHLLIAMDTLSIEKHKFHTLQPNQKQIKTAVTFWTGFNGIFDLTSTNTKFFCAKSNTDKYGFIWINNPPCADEIESLNREFEKSIIEAGLFTEDKYPITIKPNFSTFGSFKKFFRHEPLISAVPDDSIRDTLGFDSWTIFEKSDLSPNPVDILSFEKIFLESDIVHGMIFKGKRSGMFQNFTMDVDPGYQYIEKFRRGVQLYMLQSKDFLSSINFELRNQNKELVSLNDQPITFRLSKKLISF